MRIKDKILNFYLKNPFLTASEFANKLKLTKEEVRNIYKNIRSKEEIQSYVMSPLHQWSLSLKYAANLVEDLFGNKNYWNRLIKHEPVMSRTLEIHPTLGTCNYRCAMCLWSGDKKRLKGKITEKNRSLNVHEWSRVLKVAKEMGTKRILLSGGGEPLLNCELPEVISMVCQLGMDVGLYTNGVNLNKLDEYGWSQILKLRWVRVSVHSPDTTTYSNIVNVPPERHALEKVTNNIRKLLYMKKKRERDIRIGIGFVIQRYNYYQILKIVDFAIDLGVDFLDIREDGIGVSKALTPNQQAVVIRDLEIVRKKIIDGDYGATQITIADSLTGLLNEEGLLFPEVKFCFSKLFRPVINPFGFMTPCDLKSGPVFFEADKILGNVKTETLGFILKRSFSERISADCRECMPSGLVGNAVCHKIFKDFQYGILPNEQPFVYSVGDKS